MFVVVVVLVGSAIRSKLTRSYTVTTTPQHLWQTALSELELQMTRATFDTWLRGSTAMEMDAGTHTLTVGVKNDYAVEWLSNRLYPVVERAVQRLTGNGTRVVFMVEERPARETMSCIVAEGAGRLGVDGADADKWTAPDFDPGDTKRVPGWIPLPEYGTLFWAPLLGVVAWRVWELVRRSDKRREKTEFTPPLRYSIPQLARLVPCAQQSLTGRNLRCEQDHPGAQHIEARGGRSRFGGEPEMIWAVHRPGALEILEREGMAEIERLGDRKGAVVIISARVNLPLLHPSQVAQLPADLQADHDRWVAEHGLDPSDWQ
jgi:hypothetical protein